MRKQFDIELGGSKMTKDLAQHLMENVMLGGADHLYNDKTIVYNIGAFSNAIEDMQNFVEWCKEQGLKVEKKYRNREIKTAGGEYSAMIIEYEL